MSWTREQIDEWNRKQAAQGFVSALHMLAGDPAAVERYMLTVGEGKAALTVSYTKQEVLPGVEEQEQEDLEDLVKQTAAKRKATSPEED